MHTAVIILAAGQGTRMKSTLPKVLHPLCGRPMLHAVMETALMLSPERIITVVGPDMEIVERSATFYHPNAECVVQTKQLGTADAVKAALPSLEGFTGNVIVLYGDTPLIRAASVETMLKTLESPHNAVTVLGFRPKDPAEYGRMIVNDAGELHAIVEFKEATAEQRSINLCNSGVMAIKGSLLAGLLNSVDNNNAKKEYYLTDIIALARQGGHGCRFIEADEEDVQGINSRVQLAEAEAVAQKRLRLQAMENGVTLISPETVTFCFDTILGRDVIIHPYVVFGKNVQVHDGVEIKPFSHIEGAVVHNDASIGPFSRLRVGTVVGAHARIGNFVEIKNSKLENDVKINHLSYIGDADIGMHTNIGAGTITCNYDGFNKHHTSIGKNTLIGSNTALVAPVTIGSGVIIGAGSVILDDVASDALSIARSHQVILEGKGAEIRCRKKKEK